MRAAELRTYSKSQRIGFAAGAVRNWEDKQAWDMVMPGPAYDAERRAQIRKQAKCYRVHAMAVTCKLDIMERERELAAWTY